MMNRNERRAAKARAQARAGNVSRVVAVHEAGHAVGRLLTASAMGFPFDRAVHKIEVASGSSWRSFDGSLTLNSQAVCYGPAMSYELQRAFSRAYPTPNMSPDELPRLLRNVGTTGQRAMSARSKLLIIAMGPAAEARETARSWSEVFNDLACLADREACRREAQIAGLDDKAFAATLQEIRNQAEAYVAMPEVWQAINAVARNLKGTLSGDKIAHLAKPFLAPLLIDPSSVAIAA